MRTILAVAALLLVLVPALPAQANEPLSGQAVHRLFAGNTVSGRYMNRRFFTEYHHPDGRALGHNGWQPNTDACWTTLADHVCYYYGPPTERTVHCFTVEVSERLYILKTRETGAVNAVATIEPGNPRNHTDNGVTWDCDGKISLAPGGPRHLARMTSRRPGWSAAAVPASGSIFPPGSQPHPRSPGLSDSRP